MRPLFFAVACAALSMTGHAQSANPSEFASMLTFETEHSGTVPRGWGGGPAGTVFVDGAVVHGGRWAVRLERSATSPNSFSTITKTLPMDFAGATIEWRGFLRSENVSEFLGLWMRQDGDTPALAFDNMQQRQLRGTTEWTEYSITLPIHKDAKQVYFGVLFAGTGKVWADDLQLLVDGKPVWDAPRAVRPKTVLDLDAEFNGGSRISVGQLTPLQIENLARLGKVWGFLKYHHPAVTAGRVHWDYELLRVVPRLLAAVDRVSANGIMRDWVRGMGQLPPCNPCLTLQGDNLHLTPDLDWIRQDATLGRELSDLLQSVHRARPGGRQFYVSHAPGIGNPVFEHELAYADLKFPDAGYQLLALFRWWNIIEYWYPNRDILDQDWDQVLAEFIPRMTLATNKDTYQLETIALMAKLTDTHANLWNAPPQLRPPAGSCQLPVITRFIEGRAVVTAYWDATTGPATGLRVGDVIDRLDGVTIDELVARWTPYYPASNEPTRRRDMARALTKGPCSTAAVTVVREGKTVGMTAQRQPLAGLDQRIGRTHDLPGETFRLLSNDVAYLKLSSVQGAQVPSYIEQAKSTRGLVIDIRNYPSDFVVFALGSRLVDRPTAFARFTNADLDNPGAFRWSEPLTLSAEVPRYSGKVVILVDETSLSQAEYTAMAFRSAPGAIVVGSTTAGADGNVSPVVLPGGLNAMISGIGVFYPDKRPTQRVGIVPDVAVQPTIAGVRAGRDEVLEEALRQVLGRETPADHIEKMARP